MTVEANRRQFLSFAVAYLVPWIVMLGAISLFGDLLVLWEAPWWLVVNIVWVADALLAVSIVIVPLILLFQTRLARRGQFSFMPYLGIGAGIPSIAIIVVALVGIALRPREIGVASRFDQGCYSDVSCA